MCRTREKERPPKYVVRKMVTLSGKGARAERVAEPVVTLAPLWPEEEGAKVVVSAAITRDLQHTSQMCARPELRKVQKAHSHFSTK